MHEETFPEEADFSGVNLSDIGEVTGFWIVMDSSSSFNSITSGLSGVDFFSTLSSFANC